MFSPQLLTFLAATLSRRCASPVVIKTSRAVSGGCVNACYRLETNQGPFFVKCNDAARYPGMFEAEARGLKELKKTGSVDVPEVLACTRQGDTSLLLLQWIESGKRHPDFWEDFGRSLAGLHRQSHDAFGLDYNNYVGSLPQSNNFCPTWAEFFITQRLEPQLKLAAHRLPSALKSSFSSLFRKLDSFFPAEPPSLLHGDLWNGNYIGNAEGRACLLDPAIYYGHREMDLGMTQLFGGFEASFYRAYHSEYPLVPGWEERLHFCNLYPLLVHVNLFGEAYVSQIQAILKSI